MAAFGEFEAETRAGEVLERALRRTAIVLGEGHREDAAEWYAERIHVAASNCMLHLDALDLSDDGEGRRLRDGLKNLAAAASTRKYADSGSQYRPWLWSLEDYADTLAGGLLEDRQQMQALFAKKLKTMSRTSQNLAANLHKQLAAAMATTGLAAQERFREVDFALQELRGSAEPVSHPWVWFVVGYVETAMRPGQDAAQVALNHVSVVSGRERNLAMVYAATLISAASLPDERTTTSMDYAIRAFEMRPDLESGLDAMRSCCVIRQVELARRVLARLAPREPWISLFILGDPDLQPLWADATAIALAAQREQSEEAKRAVDSWRNVVLRAKEAEKLAEISIPMPGNVGDGYVEAARSIPDADLFRLAGVISGAQSAVRDAQSFAERSVEREHAVRLERVHRARAQIEGAWQLREQAVQAATQIQTNALALSQGELRASDVDGEQAQRGCAWGMGSGCMLFSLYIVLSGALAAKGLKAGLDTPIGMAAVGVALVPVAAGLMAYLAYSARRAALEARLAAAKAEADRAFRAAQDRADDHYRKQVEKAREELAQAEAELKKTEDARRVLLGGEQSAAA